MRSPHLLNLGNPRKVKEELSSILEASALAAVEDEIESNSIQLFRLGRSHYSFALRQTAPHWRQKVSRLYYAAYNISRAIRLFASGDYSTDVKDHQRFDRLPDDFPSKERFMNQLTALREDRNICDYDHSCRASDLVLGSGASVQLVEEFIREAKDYLISKGLSF